MPNLFYLVNERNMGARSKLLCGTITGLIIGVALIALGALMLSGVFGSGDESFLFKVQGK